MDVLGKRKREREDESYHVALQRDMKDMADDTLARMAADEGATERSRSCAVSEIEARERPEGWHARCVCRRQCQHTLDTSGTRRRNANF